MSKTKTKKEVKTVVKTTIVEKELFQDYITNQRHSPETTIVRLIDESKFPFAQNTFFKYNPAKLGADEFNRCVDFYIERGENGNVGHAMLLMQEIMNLEY